MVFAHFSSSGTGVVDLPAWALAYGVFAVLILVGLWGRSHYVGKATVAPLRIPRASGHTAVSVVIRLVQTTNAIALGALIVVAWTGHDEVGMNIAPIAITGVLITLGGWLSLVFGRWWTATDPFLLVAWLGDRRRSASGPEFRVPWWTGAIVLATFTIVWIAWPNGDLPRNLAIWLSLYAVVMVVVAYRGGRGSLRLANALPQILDFPAAIMPLCSRRQPTTPHDRRTIWILAPIVLAAAGTERCNSARWFVEHIAPHGEAAIAFVNIALIAIGTGLIASGYRVLERLVERARDSINTRPLSLALAPLTGGVLLAQGLHIGVVQVQNLAVLASDPLSRGWNLFGTVTWQVSQQPLSPRAAGIIQAVLILAGHVAAMSQIGRGATETVVDHPSTARFRHRCWMAAMPAMVLVTLSGVVWTLVILGN